MDVPRRKRRSRLRRFYESDRGQVAVAIAVIALICGGVIFLLSRIPEEKLTLKPEEKLPLAFILAALIISGGLKAIADAIKGKE